MPWEPAGWAVEGGTLRTVGWAVGGSAHCWQRKELLSPSESFLGVWPQRNQTPTCRGPITLGHLARDGHHLVISPGPHPVSGLSRYLVSLISFSLFKENHDHLKKKIRREKRASGDSNWDMGATSGSFYVVVTGRPEGSKRRPHQAPGEVAVAVTHRQ